MQALLYCLLIFLRLLQGMFGWSTWAGELWELEQLASENCWSQAGAASVLCIPNIFIIIHNSVYCSCYGMDFKFWLKYNHFTHM